MSIVKSLKFESTLEFRRELSGHLPLHPCAGLLEKAVYGVILTCPSALHPLGFPVVSGSLPELGDAQGDDGGKLE